jgi:hypothetical protein
MPRIKSISDGFDDGVLRFAGKSGLANLGMIIVKPKLAEYLRATGYVCVNRALSAGLQDEPAIKALTPPCVALSEIESQIDRLKIELEEIRTWARREFPRATVEHSD